MQQPTRPGRGSRPRYDDTELLLLISQYIATEKPPISLVTSRIRPLITASSVQRWATFETPSTQA